jgi:plastocyanin
MLSNEVNPTRSGRTLVSGTALLLASAITLGACAGGGDKGAGGGAPAASSTPAAGAPAAGAPAAAPAATANALPITGKTWDVKMISDAKGYRYDPANLTIKVGDGVRFINMDVSPHNVAFNTVPDASKAQLDANMPGQTAAGPAAKLGELSGPLVVAHNDSYTVSFAGVTPGAYDYICVPHQAENMKGVITVQ